MPEAASVARPETVRLQLSGITLSALAWGPDGGPLALCLHGYPDRPTTWRHLAPYLAERGWRVIAPSLRGYASDLAPDGNYQVGALVSDAAAIHRQLGDERAVLIGHDWGAVTAYTLGAWAPELFTKMVTIAIPPVRVPATPAEVIGDLPVLARQLRMSWYMFFQLLPGISERALPWLVPRLWAAWSPGYDAAEDVAAALSGLSGARRATAALRYYRALFLPWMRGRGYASEQARLLARPKVPVLYLHGDRDGCIQVALARRGALLLPAGSEFDLVADAGHFLHLERPDHANRRIAEFIGPAQGAANDSPS